MPKSCARPQKIKGGYRSFTSTPYYRRIRDNIRCGYFLGVWYDYIQLFGISDDEAIKRYCMRQPEIDEQGNKEQEGPELQYKYNMTKSNIKTCIFKKNII